MYFYRFIGELSESERGTVRSAGAVIVPDYHIDERFFFLNGNTIFQVLKPLEIKGPNVLIFI